MTKMRRVLVETAILEKDSKSVKGLALIPRISMNGVLYTPAEIARADGAAVPLNWEHKMSDVLNDVDIGTATFEYNWLEKKLYYRAEITSDVAIELMNGKDYYVSIEAEIDEDRFICNREEGDCFHMPSGLKFVGLAVTQTPGVPETTMSSDDSASESTGSRHESTQFVPLKTLIENLYIHSNVGAGMASKTAETKSGIPAGYVFVEALGYAVPADKAADKAWIERMIKAAEADGELGRDAGADVENPSPDACPEGQKRVDGECVDADNMESKKESGCGCEKEMDDDDDDKDESKEMDDDDDKDKKDESTGHGMPNMDDLSSRVSEQARKLAEYEKKLKEKREYTVTRITDAGEQIAESDMRVVAAEALGALASGRPYAFEVDLGKTWGDLYAKPFNYKAREAYFKTVGSPAMIPTGDTLKEAISYVGADRGNQLSLGMNIRIRPGGKYARSIRDLVQVREFADHGTGVNEIKEPISVPHDAQDQTEGASATNAYTEDRIHYVSLKAEQVRGTPQFVTYTDLEDTPQQIFGMLTEKSRISALDEEARLVVRAADTVSTDASEFNSIGRWIRGDGTRVTSDDATGLGEITAQTIADVKEYFQREGYDTGFGSIKLACSPEQFNSLYNDPELDRYINQGAADVRRTGDLAFVNGIEIIPMNAIRTITATGGRTNAAQRAFAFVPESTFLFGIKRDMRISIIESPNRNGYDWNWTQRKNATVFDAKSLVRISTGA